MPFNQQGQNVAGNQYNAEGNINFGAGGQPKVEDIAPMLEALKQQFVKAREQGILNEDVSTDAEYQVTKALQQAKKPNPDKKSILDYLNSARGLIEGVAAASSFVPALVHIAENVQKLF